MHFAKQLSLAGHPRRFIFEKLPATDTGTNTMYTQHRGRWTIEMHTIGHRYHITKLTVGQRILMTAFFFKIVLQLYIVYQQRGIIFRTCTCTQSCVKLF